MVKMLKPSVRMLGETDRAPWESNSLTPKRMAGRALQRARAELFAREPLCRICKSNGRTSAAVIRDHITPLAEGGTDDDSNVQPLCQTCSDLKTAEEAKRGIARARGTSV